MKTSAIKWQHEGFAWREAFVRLPQGMTLQDLNDSPTIWANIQDNVGTALRQFDQIHAVAYDETWLLDATVSFADRGQVILAGIRKVEMPKRSVALFEDENYRVEWAGSGYGVFRKNDRVMMGAHTFTTAEQARAHVLAQYATRAGVA